MAHFLKKEKLINVKFQTGFTRGHKITCFVTRQFLAWPMKLEKGSGVVQLVERSLLTPGIHGLNPVNGIIIYY